MTARFEVDTFEQVPAGTGTVLLRIAGRWLGPRRERLPTPLLLVDDGRRTHRVSPLPSPDDSAPLAGPDAPVWRAAFSAPVDLVRGAHVAYALDAGRGGIADLPHPDASRRSWATRQEAPADAHAQPAPPPAPPQPTSAAVAPTPPASTAPAVSSTPTAPGRGLLRGRREAPSGPDPRALARELETLRAAVAAERVAREQAERQAAEAHALAQRATADAQHAMELAARAEAARAGAVDALADERLRKSERVVAEEERDRRRQAEATEAADQARRAAVVAHEAQRALQEREAELEAAREEAGATVRRAEAAEARVAELERAVADAEGRAADLLAALERAASAERERDHERLGRQAADRRAEQAEQRIRALDQQVAERDERLAALEGEVREAQRQLAERPAPAAGGSTTAPPGDGLASMATAPATGETTALLTVIHRERLTALGLFGVAAASGAALLAGAVAELLR